MNVPLGLVRTEPSVLMALTNTHANVFLATVVCTVKMTSASADLLLVRTVGAARTKSTATLAHVSQAFLALTVHTPQTAVQLHHAATEGRVLQQTAGHFPAAVRPVGRVGHARWTSMNVPLDLVLMATA